MRERTDTPQRMVVDGQVAEFGAFKEPFREVNLLDLELVIGGVRVPRAVADLRLKEWEHFGIVNDEYYFGMVIFDAKFMGTSFFYAFNRKTGEFFEHERTSVGAPLGVARELMHGECYYRNLGYRMEFENRLDSGMHRLRAEIKGKGRKPAIDAEIFVLEDLVRFQPLVVVSPVGPNRPLYTHKSACPVEGKVKLGDRLVVLDPDRDVALMDVQKTFYPYNTFWKWTTFGGRDADGRLIGMNACQNFIADDERYNENCTWVDGEITLASATRFAYDEDALLEPWKITASGGDMDLEFKPEGQRQGKINFGVLMSDFHQPFGTFSGTMAGPGGSTVEVDGPFGLCEHHLARF
jgi:hypothetical protein